MESRECVEMEEIAYDEKTVINNMRSLVDLKGKRVLELGGNLNEDIVRECGVVEWVSVDPMKEDYISRIEYINVIRCRFLTLNFLRDILIVFIHPTLLNMLII